MADEVRNLAQRAAQSAKETSAKIENSVSKTNQGVQITEKVTFDADAGYISGAAGWAVEFREFVIERPKP